MKELGEREVTLKDELQPLQGRLAGNWDELKGLEEGTEGLENRLVA